MLKKLSFAFVILSLVGMFTGLVLVLFVFKDLPHLKSLKDYNPALVTNVYSQEGKLIGEFFGNERRYKLKVNEIPDLLVKAFTSAEDDRFFEHAGIDFQGIIRATIANLKAGRVVQGGSTITQQVAKSILKRRKRSFVLKFKEAILAAQLEFSLSKREIINIYLNQIYLGRGSYGVEAASKTYFNKKANELTVAEAALLAGLVQAPSKYSPFNNADQARRRQLYVLNRMLETGFLNQKQLEEAKNESVKLYLNKDFNLEVAPYYVEYARQYLLNKYGQDMLYTGGMRVTVAADYDLSLKAQKAVQENLRNLDKREGYRGPIGHIKKKEELVKELLKIQYEIFEKKFSFRYLPLSNEQKYSKEEWRAYSYEKAKELEVFENTRELLIPNETYRAIVAKFSRDKKKATVLIGNEKASIDIKDMSWAYRVSGDQTANGERIKYVTDALKKGDVLMVRVIQSPQLPDDFEIKKFQKKEEEEKYRDKYAIKLALEQEPIAQSALVSMEADTGKVIAMVGGYDFSKSEYNRVIQGERQPGSVFKPFVYAAALDKGYTPASIIVDSPLVFENQGDEESFNWIPSNHSEKSYGDTTLRTALIKSRNIPTVKLLQEIKVPYLIDYVRNIGVTSKLNPDLSLALGSSVISLMEITKTYALFPRNGLRMEPVYILKVSDRDGNVLEEHLAEDMEKEAAAMWLAQKEKFEALQEETEVDIESQFADAKPESEEKKQEEDEATAAEETKELSQLELMRQRVKAPSFDDPLRAMESKTAFIMADMLQQAVQNGTGIRAKALKRKVGGKTGTTSDFIDAWFVGFSSELVTGVWTGFDTPRSLGKSETGSRAALPAWVSYMGGALKKYAKDDFEVPKGIVFVSVDPITGELVDARNKNSMKMAFIDGTEPSKVKSVDDKVPASSDFYSEDFKLLGSVFWLK